MRSLLVGLILLGGVARAEPFPVPGLDGKVAATAERVVRVPMRFAKVEAFYRQRFAGEPKVRLARERLEGGWVLTLTSRREGDAWAKAVVREQPVDTIVEVTPMVHLQGDKVEGRPPPLVQLVLPPSADEVRRMANSIDHMPKH
jgi:hypothetical protein